LNLLVFDEARITFHGGVENEAMRRGFWILVAEEPYFRRIQAGAFEQLVERQHGFPRWARRGNPERTP
jgi:hypothetical protein